MLTILTCFVAEIMQTAEIQFDNFDGATARHGSRLPFLVRRWSCDAEQENKQPDITHDLNLPVRALHAVILIGSTAYGMQTKGSDIDLVLIARTNRLESICDFVLASELEQNHGQRQDHARIEYTVLTAAQVEELFLLASPFAFAIRCGRVLHDDGYHAALCNKPFPSRPVKAYYTKCLYDNIARQYFSLLRKTEDEVRKNGCSPNCCHHHGSCTGLTAGADLPVVILRMLYLTLPYRGLIPLTKNDVVDFAETFYPAEITTGVTRAVTLLRKNADSISYMDYRALKKASVKLFREILSILGRCDDARTILKDAANTARGSFQFITDTPLRNCLV